MQSASAILLAIVAHGASGSSVGTSLLSCHPFCIGFLSVIFTITSRDSDEETELDEEVRGANETYVRAGNTAQTSSPRPLVVGLSLFLPILGATALWFLYVSRITVAQKDVASRTTDTAPRCHEISEKSQSCAIPIPQTEDELEALLKGEGIDTSGWGDATPRLLGELMRGECRLTYAHAIGQPDRLAREVRLLFVRVAATFPTGLMTLMKPTPTGKYKNVAKRINSTDDTEERLADILAIEVMVPIEWQKRHLKTVIERTTILDSQGGARGSSFPGLTSQYLTEEVWMKVVDINATAVSEKLHCGLGVFDIEGKDETRAYEWTNATDSEREAYDQATQAQSAKGQYDHDTESSASEDGQPHLGSVQKEEPDLEHKDGVSAVQMQDKQQSNEENV